jgi:preprotein translocase subunit SecA
MEKNLDSICQHFKTKHKPPNRIKKKKNQKLSFAFRLIQLLKKGIQFDIDEKRRDVFLMEEGYSFIQNFFKIKDLYDIRNPWAVEILNALKAKYLYKSNKDYVIINEQIVIVDEFTGRIMPDRKWSLGLHQAIELKENLVVNSYKELINKYPKIFRDVGVCPAQSPISFGIECGIGWYDLLDTHASAKLAFDHN